MQVSYGTWADFPGGDRARGLLLELVAADGVRDLIEVGAGANP